MIMIATIAVVIVALLQLSFMYIEMILWTKPYGLKVFRQTREQAEASRVLAANQGLYNGLLAAGLIWGLWCADPNVTTAFLAVVLGAGIYGGATASRKIWLVQALPAALGLAAVFFL